MSWLHFKCHEIHHLNLSLPFPSSIWSGKLTNYTWQERPWMTIFTPLSTHSSGYLSSQSRALPNKAWDKGFLITSHDPGPFLSTISNQPQSRWQGVSGMNNYTLPSPADLSWNVLPNWLVLMASCNPKFCSFEPGATSSKTFTTGFCLKTYPL